MQTPNKTVSHTPAPSLAYIGLGSNLGDRLAILQSAAQTIVALPRTQILRSSSLYQSAAAEGALGSGDFFNAVLAIRTQLSAHALLEHLQGIETEAGRQRPYRHAPRTLDLDILLFGDSAINDPPRLIIPHPRMWQRDFVMLPLLELAPELARNQQYTPSTGGNCQIQSRDWLKAQTL